MDKIVVTIPCYDESKIKYFVIVEKEIWIC